MMNCPDLATLRRKEFGQVQTPLALPSPPTYTQGKCWARPATSTPPNRPTWLTRPKLCFSLQEPADAQALRLLSGCAVPRRLASARRPAGPQGFRLAWVARPEPGRSLQGNRPAEGVARRGADSALACPRAGQRLLQRGGGRRTHLH